MLVQWKTTSAPFFHRAFNRHVDEVFAEFFGTAATPRSHRGVIKSESDEAYTLRAALPGVSANDLSLEVKDGVLTLTATRSNEAPEGYKALRRERGALNFEHSFTLGPKVDIDGIEASFEHGVLTVTLPKQAQSKPRQISIAAA